MENTTLTAKKGYYDMIFHCQEAIKSNGGQNLRFDENNTLTADYKQDRVKLEFQEQKNGKTKISLQCRMTSTLRSLKRDIEASFMPKDKRLTAMKVPEKSTVQKQDSASGRTRMVSKKKQAPPFVHQPRNREDDRYLKEIMKGWSRQSGNSKRERTKRPSEHHLDDSTSDDDHHHKKEMVNLRQKSPPPVKKEKPIAQDIEGNVTTGKEPVKSKDTLLVKTNHQPFSETDSNEDNEFLSEEVQEEEYKEKETEIIIKAFMGGLVAIMVLVLYCMFY